ncbi:unnamed protein product [Sphagnum jensenii]|uniref:FAS1 domain-containing protein n=1 Tax=Sphagnum jensenii TaxID=128206 RepID=A0ABP1A4Y8_9BRYO
MNQWKFVIVFFIVLFSFYAARTGQELFFVFGDSYADTGNIPRTGPFSGVDWLYPYGITWPGYPDGRFCDGRLQTDWLAELLGIPTPPAYLNLTDQSTANGVNFATAGSGVIFAYGENPLGGQVDNLELFLRTDPYSKKALAKSVTLVSVNGNDYTAFNGNTSTASTVVYIERVVAGIAHNLQRLYDFGLRDVMVSNLLPASCVPVYTKQYNYSKCDTAIDSLNLFHNQLLLGAVKEINAGNPGARFIILDAFAAFSQLFEQANAVGFTEGLVPCCQGLGNNTCAATDPTTGKPLYTLCKDIGKALFWDYEHPTQSAWHYIINLFATTPGFILLADAPTLLDWFKNNAAIQAGPVAPPMPQPDPSLAAGEEEQAFNEILPNVNYSETLALLQSVDVAALLGQTPAGKITVFLPNNQAYLNAYDTAIDMIFSNNLVNNVVFYHIVPGSVLDYNTLLSSHPSNLTTAIGLQLPVTFQPSLGIFVGQASTAAQIKPSAALIVQPNLYLVPGEVVVHGINNILFPPGIMY